MTRPARALLALIPLLASGALAALPAGPPLAATVEVLGPGAADAMRAVGAPVLDDYGAFATAPALALEQARAMEAGGFTVAPLSPETGRGEFRFDARGADPVPASLRLDGGARSLVAFRGPVKAEWRAALAEAATVYDYLPSNSFVVKGDRAALAALPGVLFVGPYHAGYKLAPGLAGASSPLELTVLAFPDEPLDQAARAVEQAGGHVTAQAEVPGLEGLLRVEASPAALPAIARVEAVSWIERAPGPASLDNEHATAVVQGGDPGVRALNLRGIDGSTQLGSICDTGVDTTGTSPTAQMVHEMFADPANPTVTYMQPNPLHRKVLLYYSPVEGGVPEGDFDDGDSHGTHTAGTLAGDAPPYGVANSHDAGAFAAKLAVCDIVKGTTFVIPAAYRTMWDPAYAAGARVNSNSWGSSPNNDYTDVARQEDAYVWDHRDFAIFRSAGNTGPTGAMRPEAVAKDVLAVASSKNSNSGSIEDLSSFSSRGPAADGRLKPDITAPGECLNSARQGTADQYVCESGTSMATPTAASAALLVRDYFAKGYWPQGSAGSGPFLAPSAALLRAVLYASGHEMTGSGSHGAPYLPQLGGLPEGPQLIAAMGRIPIGAATPVSSFPNPDVGWGRVNLSSALPLAGGARQLVLQDEGAGLATGGSAKLTFTVRDASQPLRVVLAWTDQAASSGANPALVNDLDLTVTDPGGLAYPGNNALGDASLPAGLPDRINNAEGVEIATPTAGTYTITVTGANVPQGPQPWAVVAVGGLAS